MTMIEPERVTRKEAAHRGLDQLLDDASERPIAVETGDGEVVMVPGEVVDAVLRLLRSRDDLYDALLVVARMATDNGERIALDDLITELGFTQDEIDAADD